MEHIGSLNDTLGLGVAQELVLQGQRPSEWLGSSWKTLGLKWLTSYGMADGIELMWVNNG